MAKQLTASHEETCSMELANSNSIVNLAYSLSIHCKSRSFAKTILLKSPTAFPHLVTIHVIRVSTPTLPPSSGTFYANMLGCVYFIILVSHNLLRMLLFVVIRFVLYQSHWVQIKPLTPILDSLTTKTQFKNSLDYYLPLSAYNHQQVTAMTEHNEN